MPDTLENLRRRLLDLSNRNRLLNFRHTKRGSLRVIDEIPDQLYTVLLDDKEMRFGAVREPSREDLIESGYMEIDPETGKEAQLQKRPSAEKWAEYQGLSTGYELPVSGGQNVQLARHQDNIIQTLLYPDDLEAILRNIRSRAETMIEETGANVLYMAFGFLEWYESRERNEHHLAPLVLVPVKLVARQRCSDG